MRLICPNCDAEYEVDNAMIPPSGRDVQCSNCELVWFQAGQVEFDEKPEIPMSPVPPQRQKMDPGALAIIEEEVAFETKARETETTPDTDREGSGEVAAPTRSAMIDTPAEPSPKPAPERSRPAGTGREQRDLRFQDVEEINSALPDAPAPETPDAAPSARVSRKTRYARGYRSGFGLILIAAAGMVVTYANAPMIAQRAPNMTSGLAGYVRSVDTLRVWLDSAALGLTEQMGNLVDNVSDS